MALEKFTFKWGGHLILWDLHQDLHLVIDFPPGSLIHSASLCHGNTTIQPSKNQYSIMQYTVGGILRWMEQGFQKTTKWWKSLSRAERAVDSERDKEHWVMSVRLS